MLDAPDSTPFVWTAGRGALRRLVAHVLIRLLVLSPLPPHLQLGAALFPLSLAWPFVAAAEPVPEPTEKAGEPGDSRGCVLPLSERATGVSGSGREGYEPLRLISYSDPLNPQIVAELSGVGGRIVLTDSNLLLSTSGSMIANPNDPLRGIHATALGRVALVRGTNPQRVVVGEKSLKSAEPFKLEVQVVPAATEVQSAYVEYVLGEQRVGAPVNVSLTNGRGELSLAQGFSYPWVGNQLALPRLVVNEGTSDELKSHTRPWRTSEFQVSLKGEDHNDLEGDYEGDFNENGAPAPLVAGGTLDHIGDAVAANGELVRRKAQGEAGSTLTLAWQQQGGVAIYPDQQQRDDGYYSTFLEGRKVSGAVHQATARAGDVVLGISESVVMLPGPAQTVTLNFPGDGFLPADGKTEVAFTVVAKDADGNLVADNTPARCVVDAENETEGAIVGADDPLTQNGLIECRYRAGVEHLSVDRVTVEIDDVLAERDLTLLRLMPTVSLNSSAYSVGDEVVATLRAGNGAGERPADGAEVSWFLPLGVTTLQRDEVMTNGEATARFRLTRFTDRFIDVLGMVGSETATATAQVAATPGDLLRIEQNRRILAGDLPSDGVARLPAADGGTLQVPVHVTSDITVSGGQAGQTVTLRLGTLDAPNREPEARYLMESVAGGVVADVLGRHPAAVNATVTVALDSSSEGGTSLRFPGDGRMTIPSEGALAQSLGLQVELSVKPDTGFGAGTLIKRDGAFVLSLLPDTSGHRVHLAVLDGGVERTVDGAVIPDGAWARIDARLDSGQVRLLVGQTEASASVTTIDAGSGDLVVGDGLVGQVDDLRLYHTSGASPPLFMLETPQGLSESAEAVVDQSGNAFFVVRAMPVLPPPPANADNDLEELRDMMKRSYWVGFRAQLEEDYAEGRIGSTTRGFSALMSYLSEGLQVGGSEYSDPEAVLADATLGFTPIGIATTARDAVNIVDRSYAGHLRGQDRFQASMLAVAMVVAAVASRRAKAVKDAVSAARIIKSMDRMRKAGYALPNIGRTFARAAKDEQFALRLEHVLKALLDHGDEVAEATMKALAAAERNLVNIQRMNKVLAQAGTKLPEVAKALGTIANSGPKAAVLLQDTVAIAQHSAVVTENALEGARRLAMGLQRARESAVKGVPGAARLANIARNFGASQARKVQNVLEDVAGIADDSSENVHRLVKQLSSLKGPNNYIAKGADGVVQYAKSRGARVSAFERKLDIPGIGRREYDASYKLASGAFHDVDVKAWKGFSRTARMMLRGGNGVRPGKEAWKLQKDIVLKFLDPNGAGNYTDLQWAIPKGLNGSLQAKRAQIGQWMLEQFESEYVVRHIPLKSARDEARRLFDAALRDGLLDFY